MSKLSDNIWFTRKARIQASERLLSNDNHSQILLIIYSIINTCLAVILLKDSSMLGGKTDLALVIMSIVILVTSLFVTNKNFKSRAEALKNHYIELQNLYFLALDAEKNEDQEKINELRAKYTDLLELSENHNTIDDYVFRVFNKSSLTSRKPSKYEIVITLGYKIARLLILIFLYTSPVVTIYMTTFL
ncbi:SLATT domain-containing protein [uncultured Thiothrix sp.]|uniref:SLATT domain-containing protein n=1 Tax=uncultured Thiothrix sp. TaxID=223185 RepID=UPI00262642A5|nr:SLATT domain-containing protein [uncultured Thiothrix sp.]HMT94197.1 SLATT domain-containing protein [Thiolinea sp.]